MTTKTFFFINEYKKISYLPDNLASTSSSSGIGGVAYGILDGVSGTGGGPSGGVSNNSISSARIFGTSFTGEENVLVIKYSFCEMPNNEL